MVFITGIKAKRVNGKIEVIIFTFNLSPPLFPYYAEAETDIGMKSGSIRLAMPPGTGDNVEVSDRYRQASKVTARVKFLGGVTDEKTVAV